MAPITTVLAALVLIATPLVSATKLTTWSGNSCNQGDVVVWTGHERECTRLNNVQSLRLTQLDSGCTVTYYSDFSCSDNPAAARVGDCDGYQNSGKVRSMSWDC